MKRLFAAIIATLAALVLQGRDLGLRDIYIRDPFILVDKGTYYLYASSSVGNVGGVAVYTSTDLEKWTEKTQVMTIPVGNWSRGQVWAPRDMPSS